MDLRDIPTWLRPVMETELKVIAEEQAELIRRTQRFMKEAYGNQRRVNAQVRRELRKKGYHGLHRTIGDYLISRWVAGDMKVTCREIELATNVEPNWIGKAIRDFGVDKRHIRRNGMQSWVYDIEKINISQWFQDYTKDAVEEVKRVEEAQGAAGGPQ